MSLDSKKTIISWSLYDWANSAFATTVMAGFFPVFFSDYWSKDVDTTTTTALLGLANSIGSIIVAVMAPMLGAIADQGTTKKKFLLFFCFLGVLMSAGLYWVGEGNYMMAIFLYVFGAIGFSGGNVFYDSLLTGVASDKSMDKVSSLGFALGYLGGGVLFSLNVAMALFPETFGFSSAAAAVQFSFLSVAVWWAVFSIPIFLFVPEPENEKAVAGESVIKKGFIQLKETFAEIRQIKTLFLFLIAYFLYIDGVDTIVRMAVDYGKSLNFETNDLITALLLTQFVAFPAAIAFGFLGSKIGAKKAIFIAIAVYLFVCIWGAFIQHKNEFYMLATIIGLVQGGIQALSRSYYAKIIPKDKSAQFFGFYNMVGKSAAIIGPILLGSVGILMRNAGFSADTASRVSLSSIAILFILGGSIFYFVDGDKARQEVENLYGK